MTSETPDYDYIVIGSGAGGGPLAANLARAGYRVCLLEAGGRGTPPNYEVPVFHPFSTEDPDLRWEYFVRHYENQEQQEKDDKFVPSKDGIFYPRAAHLGGCTAHHAMITVYPNNRDWDHIADVTGDESWRADKMRDYFVRLEDCRYRKWYRFWYKLLRLNPTRHGFSGWLPTQITDPKLILQDKSLLRTLAKMIVEVIGDIGDRNRVLERLEQSKRGGLDPNDWGIVREQAQGVRFTPLSIDGVKRSAVREYLATTEKEHPEHLHIKTEVLVSRILFDRSGERPRATGVEYHEGADLYQASAKYDPDRELPPGRELLAKREVILAAGAFNTPQLLKLSGIGPREELEAHGIEVILDRQGVGTNMQDRYEVGIISDAPHNFSLLNEATFEADPSDPHFKRWLEQREGVYSTNGAVVSIICKSDSSQPSPDLFIFGVVGPFKGYYPGYSGELRKTQRAFTWAVLKARTENRGGKVTLRSADPRHTPNINFHYFEEGTDRDSVDLAAVSEGMRLVRQMLKASDGMLTEVYPGEEKVPDDETSRREFVRNNAWGHHASCTCPIGPASDERSVCDSRFRVIGTDGLRIVDASVFPRIPGFFIVLPIFMISEKASDVIIEDAKH